MAKQFKGIAADFIKAMKLQFIGKGADPNDIFVQDLYDYQSNNPQVNALSKLFKHNNPLNLNVQDRKILEGLYASFNEHITNKRDLLTQSRDLYENSDVVRTLIDVVLDDGFNNFYNEQEEFKIEYRLDEEERNILGIDFENNIQNIIDEFVDKFNIRQKVADLVPELIRDGEYAFGISFDQQNKEGITQVIDDIDVIDLLPYYEGDNLVFIIKQDTTEQNSNKRVCVNPPKFYKPDNFIFFRLKGPNKKKINLSMFYDNEFRQTFYKEHGIRLPKYIRIPTPMYDSAIRYLNRLKVMENVSTVLDLMDVLRPEIISVGVPANTTDTEAKEMIRNYERHLNDSSILADSNNLDVQTLASQANYRKVLPLWQDSKGTISTTGVGDSSTNKTNSAWDSIGRIRNLIALAVGIPSYYLNISEQPQDKAQTIKLYSRYTNKLTSLQKCLSEGVKDFIMAHLTHKGINISRKNIFVTFKSLTSGDNLDDLDLMVGTIEGINNYYKGLKEIVSDEDNDFVMDQQQFKQFYDKATSRYLNSKDILVIRPEQKNQSSSEQNDDFESGMGSDDFEMDDGFEVTDSQDSMGDLVGGSEEPITSGEESPYDNFARQDDGINLQGNQEITTET